MVEINIKRNAEHNPTLNFMLILIINTFSPVSSQSHPTPIHQSHSISTHVKAWNTFVPLRAFQALFAASCHGHTVLVANLLDNAAANVSMLTKNRHSVLHVASSNGHLDCVDLLLSRGADSKLADLDGQ